MLKNGVTGEANLFPGPYRAIVEATKASGFTMASDVLTCSLLRTLAASKAAGRFLELGTGTGLSTSWILDGMDQDSFLISIDNDPLLLNIAKNHLGMDPRIQFDEADGGEWIEANKDLQFDYIFADTWHGKYLLLDEVLEMLINEGFTLLTICYHNQTERVIISLIFKILASFMIGPKLVI